MKIRDLKTTWPPQWIEAGGRGDASTLAEDGKLVSLERLGSRLLLRINVNGQLRTASLLWEPPPSVGDVETVLLASIGMAIRDLANLELPATRTRTRYSSAG